MPTQNVLTFDQDLDRKIHLVDGGSISNVNNNGVVVKVNLYHRKEAASVSGIVVGSVVCPDWSTVTLSGSHTGNTVSVTIDADCVAIPGMIGLGIQVVDGTTKTTVFRIMFRVDIVETDNPVDPGSRTTLHVAELIAAIESAEASIPSDYSALLHTLASDFSASAAYAAGDYVWYNGTLYRFTANHAAGSWTGTDATAAVIGNELSNLKNASERQNFKTDIVNDRFTDFASGYYVDFPISSVAFTYGYASGNLNRVYANGSLPVLEGCVVEITLANYQLTFVEGTRSIGSWCTGSTSYTISSRDVSLGFWIRKSDSSAISNNEIAAIREAIVIRYYPPNAYTSGPVADLLDDLDFITEPNHNLWIADETITFTQKTDVTFSPALPAGTYTFSALVTSNDTDAVISRFQINSGSVMGDLRRNVRSSATITTPDPITTITLYAARNTATSADDTATFADIQIEDGSIASTYSPHGLTAIDSSTRNRLDSIVKYVSTTGSDNNDGNVQEAAYATLMKALRSGATTIYVLPGTYTEDFTTIYQAYQNRQVNIIAYGAVFNTTIQLRFVNADVNIYGMTVNIVPSSNTYSGFYLTDCSGEIKDCIVNNATSMGFRLDGCKMTLERCIAANCTTDGFNAHTVTTGKESELTLINCVAHDCGDDGASVHESGKMYVIGGEYYNNVQTGLAPHNYCTFEMLNVHCHNNRIGIEAVLDELPEGAIPATGRIIGCILNNNTLYGIDAKYYNVLILGNGFAENGGAATHRGTGATITSFTAS